MAVTTEYGTDRANGVWLLEQALNLKTPTIYDVFEVDGREERVLNQEATPIIPPHGNHRAKTFFRPP